MRSQQFTALRVIRDENGQVLPWVALMLVVFLGMTAFVVDIGHAMLVQRELQISVNAAALAGAQSLPFGDYTSAATKYSSAPGQLNATIDSSVTVNSPTINPKCLTLVSTSFGVPCQAASGGAAMIPNAIQVVETAKVPMFFAEFLGFKTLTVSATATASKGSQPLPLNVAIVLDTTPSMDEGDSSCNTKSSKSNTQLTCAQSGVQEMLTGLNPTMDRISLFTFPNVLASTTGSDTDCSSNTSATPEPVTFPASTKGMLTQGQSISQTNVSLGSYYTGSGPLAQNAKATTSKTGVAVTYQVAGYSTDFKSSGTSKTLDTSSSIVDAAGGKSGCTGMQSSDEYTYFAGALFAAQATLLQQSYENPGSQNVIVLLSDGNSIAHQTDMITKASLPTGSTALYATASGTYPSWVGQCGQAVDAANEIKSEGTMIFAIAYGSPTNSALTGGEANLGSCPSDIPVKGAYAGTHPNITPCQTMQAMSGGSNPTLQYFFADNYISTGAPCTGTGGAAALETLDDIFSELTGELTASRLIPNNAI